MDLEIGPECTFLIPIRRDSDGEPHAPITWRLLEDALLKRFQGLSGPESVWLFKQVETVKGKWIDEASEIGPDESRKYTIALPESQVEELCDLLRLAGNSFDQRAMYLSVGGVARILEVKPDDGFLEI